MSRLSRIIPEGDNRERDSCLDCGHVFYENPKIIVGSVVVHDGRVLLCRRAIEPRRGFWTLPAGYLELNETPEEGAAREALEEAGAQILLDGVLAIYSVSRISQVQIIYRARFVDTCGDRTDPHFAAGDETLEAALFRPEDIPTDEIAFPSVQWALDAWRRAGTGPLSAPARNPATDQRGDIFTHDHATLTGAS